MYNIQGVPGGKVSIPGGHSVGLIQDSIVGTATGYRVEGRGVKVRVLVG
jgi:hypothetical protein